VSASEKLKALTTFDYLGPDANDMDGEAWGDAVDTDALTRALPQIVAVVEAAETWDRVWTESYDSNWEETHAALDALDEALS
jgi:hypothetical protein